MPPRQIFPTSWYVSTLLHKIPSSPRPAKTTGTPRIRERGWILKDGDTWRLWYTGYDGTRDGKKMLGLATSPDGLRWTRHSANPIYRDRWVEDMQVIKHGDTYYMFSEGNDDQAQLLKSADGLAWERVGQLDVRLKNGEPIPPGPYGTPTAFFENENGFCSMSGVIKAFGSPRRKTCGSGAMFKTNRS